VRDEDILDAKAAIDAAGIGCEPASAASVAGVRRMIRAGVVAPDADVVCVLTGHLLKDPDAVVRYHDRARADGASSNPPQEIEPTIDELRRVLDER
jgi:threonine synthase